MLRRQKILSCTSMPESRHFRHAKQSKHVTFCRPVWSLHSHRLEPQHSHSSAMNYFLNLTIHHFISHFTRISTLTTHVDWIGLSSHKMMKISFPQINMKVFLTGTNTTITDVLWIKTESTTTHATDILTWHRYWSAKNLYKIWAVSRPNLVRNSFLPYTE